MLNNHGWGMRDMIIYSCVILIFLLITTYYVRSLYRGLSMGENVVEEDRTNDADKTPYKEIDYSLYKNYEDRMSSVAIDYVIKYYSTLNTSIASVDLNDLIREGFIETLYDQRDGSRCMGYTNVWDQEDGSLRAASYIRCPSYTTSGYIS